MDGTLWGWGTQRNGELGLDGAFNAAFSSPVQIGTSNTWLDVASSLTSVLALKDNGSLWAWGKNAVAQLGLNDTVNRSSPTQVGSFGSWRKIFVDTIDNGGAAAIKNDGTLWCWGGNGYGKLGINRGAAARASSPTQVGLDTNWKSIRITIRNVYYVKTDGTLWITGSGFDGQFGNNTAGAFAGDRSSPVQLGTDTNWHQVYGPAQTCVAIKNDGTLWAWGANTASPGGILGWTADGISIQRSSPIQVAYVGPYNRWVDIANQGTAIALIRKTNIDPEDNSLPQQY
jgi:alpha-tubulin suppressor-like RCC1 family protein